MKAKINDFVDLFPDFHALPQTAQMVRIAFFHTVEEGRESISKTEMERLFRFADLPVPANLPEQLSYLSGKAAKLINNAGEFSLRRESRKEVQAEVDSLRGTFRPPPIANESPFNFGERKFSDAKVAALLSEIHRCYLQQCWNACGILIRIVIERTLDTVDAAVKAKSGLKDKINVCRNLESLSKTLREGLDGLQNAKLMGDIAAHHSKVILDKADIELVLPIFRVLLKEVQTV
jgi:hypothetical protein